METPSIDDFARRFMTQTKGWSAKNQIVCKVAKIYHREGLEIFAQAVGWEVERLEEAYALKVTMQKENRRRRGQRPIKRKRTRDLTTEEIVPPGLLNWYQRKDLE